ncbi:S10 family peptidase [Arenibaculum pallidiluteum]|uniref:S10 family peptidase n=1 Tax=Arenibaculum pallidiluteum TaxID=2812559 RepID=UPI001A9686EE|nr:septum formation initiator [Arenibaculum pallidiluteum]
MRLLVLLLALLLPAVPPALAQERPSEGAGPRDNPQAAAIGPVEIRGAIDAGGQRIAYRAVAESLPVTNGRGEVAARIFTTSYTAEDVGGAPRPVTFVFNGGPGAASAFLHMGAMGPVVLATTEEGRLAPPPARLQDNPATWLAFTDLVFVDPVGTGYSRAARTGDEAERPFWSVSGDIRSLNEVLRLWLTREGRWSSPVFLAGESYGGFRVARLARSLAEGPGIAVAGVIMISPVIEFSTIAGNPYDVMSWALALPSMAASARALGRGDTAMDQAAVERFALGEYLTGIAAIAPPGAGPDEALVRRLSALLGLEPDVVRRHHGRIPIQVFSDRVLGEPGRAVSLYDGAYAGPDPYPAGGRGPDVLLDASIAPVTSAFVQLMRDRMGLRTDVPFLLLDRRPSRNWDWEGSRNEAGALDQLAEALATTPDLSALVVHGETDLVTPYMASRWLIDRLALPEEVRSRVRVAVLQGGHMMYFRPADRTALTEAARSFYAERLPRPDGAP